MPLQSFKSFLIEGLADNTQDITKSAVKLGDRLGSNEGGTYSLGGEKHYVKFYRDPQQAVSEVAAAHVYGKIGVGTVKPFLVKHGTKMGVASKWQEGLQGFPKSGPDYKSWSDEDKQQLAHHFVAAVVTKNWDAVGLEHDNMARDAGGKLINNDLGGVMRFRAQGGPKPFGDDIDEHQSLRNPNLPSGKAFRTLSDHHIHTAIKSLKNLDRGEMAAHFKSLGLKDADEHAATIHGRAQRLLRLVGE